MSQIGVRCVRGEILHQDCRECALNPLHPCAYTPDMLEGLRRLDQHEPVFSPTRILGCQRREVLRKEVDWYEDIDTAYPLLRGRMVHALVEEARYPGALDILREQQFHTTVQTSYGPQEFEGTVDLIVVKDMTVMPGPGTLPRVVCKVVDYKTASQVGHDLTAAYDSYIAQVNIYRWLVTRELPKQLGWPAEVDVDELEILYAGYNKPRRFTSAGPLQAKGKMLTRKPPTYDTLDLAPIPLWDMDKVEAAVVRRIEARLARKEGELPDVLPEEDQWQCLRCPVSRVCWERWNNGH